MIEAWWRVLKHQGLCLNSLDSVSTFRRLVTFYVQEHYMRLPHSAFRGQTPDFKETRERELCPVHPPGQPIRRGPSYPPRQQSPTTAEAPDR